MKRTQVKELYYITHVDNVRSLVENGILCHNKAQSFKHKSIADEKIQKRRDKAIIPGGKSKLHDYANLYFNPRNAMMCKVQEIRQELAVLKIDSVILEERDVVISDANASSDYVRFYPSPEGLEHLDAALVYASDWRDPDTFQYWKRKSAVCAEVLMPNLVPRKFITGIYVYCEETKDKVIQMLKGLPISKKVDIKRDIFII
jgi:hypothetical protein